MEQIKLVTPDDLIRELGGCGRFQVRLSILIHTIKIAICWSLGAMTLVAKTPPWWCADDVIDSNMTSSSNDTSLMMKSCVNRNGTACQHFQFDGSMKTLVSELNLVCDLAFVPSTIMSIQLAGMFVGNPLSGQIADLIGRKKPIFIGLFFLTVFNIISIFCTNWILFAVCRFFIGLGSAFFLTVQYNLMSEYSLASWRPWITGFPSWAIQNCLLVLLAWLLLDVRHIMIACCIVSGVFLLTWSVVPESFRWHLSHDRIREAESIIKVVADFNKRQMPDLNKFHQNDTAEENGDHRRYTFLDLFKSRYLAKVTILCASNWFALGFVAYGLGFGVQAMSGNLFVNMVLFALAGIPAKCIASVLLNRIGRRNTSLVCFALTSIGGFVVGAVQYIDTDYRVELTNGFALMAFTAISAAWGSVQTMTIEMYPTVVRNIGFGSLSTIGRLGAIIGPQMVFLDMVVPGLLYFVSGGISVVCILALIFLPETKGGNLPDKIETSHNVSKVV